MQEPTYTCPDCTAEYSADDNYCRRCGMFLVAAREEKALAPRQLHAVERYQRERSQLPAPVKRAVTAVAVGAAVQVGLSLATRYFAAQAGNKAARAALTAANASPRKSRAVQRNAGPSGLPDDIAAVAETVIVRRIWVRRP